MAGYVRGPEGHPGHGDHCRLAASRSGLEGLPPGWPCPVSWPLWDGSIGDRHEGLQVANQIHRTASVRRRPDPDRLPARPATGAPHITISKRNWSDLFAGRWLRARDLNPRLTYVSCNSQGDSKSRFSPPPSTVSAP